MKQISLLMLLVFFFSASYAQKETVPNQNWTADQLMAPADLANRIANDKTLPVIISIGPEALIPHSIDIGMVVDEKNMQAFKHLADSLPKNTDLVIYCGCCPFEHCPNVRPAIASLKQKGFTNFHLLNLPTSIKADWIDKNYPLVEEKE